ncbi:MAG: cation-translocating P-type ATPase [Aquihabitans sp.]
MKTLIERMRNQWVVPAISGLLIVASLLTERVLGQDATGDWLMVAAAIVGGTPIALKAARSLGVRVIGIDLLVSVAAGGAVIIGEYWEAAAVTFLFAFGHALEAATLNKTRSALAALVAVAPDVAVVLRGGEQVEVPAAEVATGEIVLVKNGSKVPVDGEVVDGTGSLDEASITGESMPVEKSAADRVFAGTVSRGGLLQVRATGVGADTTLARIIHRVEEAQDAKAPTAQFMDRFAAWYTPAIMLGALVAALVTGDVVLGLTLLVIGCPGALVISIPVSIVAGIGRAARDGILIKGGEFLETSARIDTVAVDKTGTLTEGRPRLTNVVTLDPNMDTDQVLGWAAVAEAGSEHPLARAILDAAAEVGVGAVGLPDHTDPVPGKGIAATTGKHRVLVGNAGLLAQYGVPDTVGAAQTAEELASAGQTPMIVALDNTPVGVIAVADTLRVNASEMVARLHRSGVSKVVMLTGDAPQVAHAVASMTGVDEVHAGLLPEDKLDAVVKLQGQGRTVAMVGDGVNDAPALATADIGVAMGAAGSAVAVETADIALMGDDLLKLPEAISLAKRTVNNMRQNITIAMVTVSLLLVGVILGGVTMAVGMLVHEASVLVVIVNAMRLLRHKDGSTTATRTVVPMASPSLVDA